MTDQNPAAGTTPPRRRTVVLLISAFLVIAVVAIVIASITRTNGGPGAPSATAGTPTATAGSSAGAGSSPTATAPVPVESTVPIDSPAEPVPGVSVAVAGFEAVQGEAELSGDVAGPAIRFTITVTNSTAETISLAGALVNVYSGPDQSPADSLAKPGGVPLPGEVAAGQSAQGTLIFTVPEDQRDDVLITFDYQLGVPVTAFQGAVPR